MIFSNGGRTSDNDEWKIGRKSTETPYFYAPSFLPHIFTKLHFDYILALPDHGLPKILVHEVISKHIWHEVELNITISTGSIKTKIGLLMNRIKLS